MPPYSVKTLPSVLFGLLFSAPGLLYAQASVWGNNSTTKTLSGKTKETKHKFKDFKEHLQNWGLDTSYKHAFLIGGKLNTDGWSGTMQFVKHKTNKDPIWQLGFSEIKHEKQTKQKGSNKTYPQLGNPTPYVYGKINNLYTLQIGYGREKLLLPSIMEGNISVSYRYNAGFSLGMLKPYFLKMMLVDYTTNTASILEDKYTRTDSTQFLNEKLILGASVFTKSIPQTTFIPGAYLETAVAIMPSKHKTFIQVITLGCNASIYAKELPIMQGQKAYPFQVNLFAGVGIGKRWK